jgi:hypothetical protein
MILALGKFARCLDWQPAMSEDHEVMALTTAVGGFNLGL